ncbi:unnamed protein product [Caenorhabditis nigoni]
MVSFLTELLSQSSKGIAQSLDNCANDTEIINALLKDSYNKERTGEMSTGERRDESDIMEWFEERTGAMSTGERRYRRDESEIMEWFNQEESRQRTEEREEQKKYFSI